MLFSKSLAISPLDRTILLSIVLGGSSAILSLSSLGMLASPIGVLLAICGLVSALPLFYVGLGYGLRALLCACCSYLAIYCGTAFTLGAGIATAVMMPLAHILPILLLCKKAQLFKRDGSNRIYWYPTHFLCNWLLAFGGLGIVLMALWPETFFPQGSQATLKHLQDMAPQLVSTQAQVEDFKRVLNVFWPFLPGMVVMSWMLLSVCSAAFAQTLLLAQGKAIRPSFSMDTFQVDLWVLVALVISGIFAFILPLSGSVLSLAQNLFLLFMMPGFVAGLATIHTLVQKREHGTIMLGVFYCFMVIFSWISVIILLLGLFEPWLRIRRLAMAQEKD